jgi:hypothetical protein
MAVPLYAACEPLLLLPLSWSCPSNLCIHHMVTMDTRCCDGMCHSSPDFRQLLVAQQPPLIPGLTHGPMSPSSHRLLAVVAVSKKDSRGSRCGPRLLSTLVARYGGFSR